MLNKEALFNLPVVFMIIFSSCSLLKENEQDKSSQISDRDQKLRYSCTVGGFEKKTDSNIRYENKLLTNSEPEKRILSVIEESQNDTRVKAENLNVADGRYLRMLTEAMGATRVVEIGTSEGILGLWFTMALNSTGGKLIIYESDAAKIKISQENFKRAGVDYLVKIIEGDPHETVKEHNEPLDILFICADREGYTDYLKQLLPFVRSGGLIVADNIGMREKGINDYIDAVTSNPALDTVFYPNGSRFSVTIKKRTPIPQYIQKIFEDVESSGTIYADSLLEQSDSNSKQRLKLDVAYFPTPQDVVDKMLELADVKKDDLLYDLGCGDGRIVVTAAKTYGCRAVGYDIDLMRVKESIKNVQDNNVGNLVKIEQKDIFTLDLSKADVITLFLLPELNVRLIPQLEKLRGGSRIVSHYFDIEGIKPDKVLEVISNTDNAPHKIYLWIAPIEKKEGQIE